MPPSPTALSAVGTAVFDDGARVSLSPVELRRVLCALAARAVTPLRQHLRVAATQNNAGDLLWPREARA